MPRELCAQCRAIDFRKYMHESTFLGTSPLAKLGSWEQICKRTQCPFCRLVRDAFSVHDCEPFPYSSILLWQRRSWKCCTSYNEYHGVRWKDYSNEYDLEAYAEKTRTGSRYQFVVQWERKPKDLVEVCLRPLSEGPFFGRLVDQEFADLSLCTKWLDMCHGYHNVDRGQCISRKTSNNFLSERLRLIDVDKMKITKGLTDGACYVALSYVWGKDKMRRETPQSLRAAVRVDEDGVETIDLPEGLPITIQDAIEVTRSIQYHYLWVDSLCIIQDDKEDTDTQFSMMGEVYSNANLTIVAGSGPHADWGLPGVSRPRHFPQRTEIVNGVEIAVEFPCLQDLSLRMGLVWDTRGWTLQEKLLSKRLLIFTEYQMYFRCANSVCTEDVAMETGTLSRSVKRRPNPFKWGTHRPEPHFMDHLSEFITLGTLKLTDKRWDLTFLPNYVALIEEYSQRELSYKKDTLKAIRGVLETWSTSDYDFPGGLPRAWLSDALLWQPRDGSIYSTDRKPSFGFPTWSWTAWSLSEGCVWPEYTKGIACRKGQMTIHIEEPGLVDSVHSLCLKSQGRNSWIVTKGPPDFCSETARRQLKTSGALISFKTPVHMFWIGEATGDGKTLPENALRHFLLLDDNNRRVGKIWANRREAHVESGRKFIALSFRKTGTALEFAVDDEYIPKRTVPTGYTDPKTGKSNPGPDIERPIPVSGWEVINVMLVDWKDDVAFRVAIGQVISTAWRTEGERLVYLG